MLVWTGGRIPKSLTEAVKAASGGVVVDTSPGRKLAGWIDEQVAASGLRLDRSATERSPSGSATTRQRLVGVLATLVGSFGPGARLGVDDIEPFLGEAGGVPPWELTDALDKGDIRRLARQAPPHDRGGGRHALQIMATLQNHYGRMLVLDGADVAGEKDAARVLGLKGSTFPARKALTQARKLGHDGVVRAVDLLAAADLDLRGRQGLARRPRARGPGGPAGPPRPLTPADRARAAQSRARTTAMPGVWPGIGGGSSRVRRGRTARLSCRPRRPWPWRPGATCAGRPGSCGSRPWPRPCRCA